MKGHREILAEKIKYLPDDKISELIHIIDFFIKDTDTGKKAAGMNNLTEKMKSLMVHVIIYQEEDYYVAHCLEFDLVAQGNSREESFQNLLDAVELQTQYALETGNPENLIQPAPPEFWRMLFKSHNNTELYSNMRLPEILSEIECGVIYS